MAEPAERKDVPTQDVQLLKKFLKTNRPVFASKLDIRNLLLEFYSADVISDEDLDHLQSMKKSGRSGREMTEDLLDCINRKDDWVMVEFVRCVNAKQPHLVKEVVHVLTPGQYATLYTGTERDCINIDEAVECECNRLCTACFMHLSTPLNTALFSVQKSSQPQPLIHAECMRAARAAAPWTPSTDWLSRCCEP